MIAYGLSGAMTRLEREGPIFLGLVGIGQMGRALLTQTLHLPGFRPKVLVDHRPERAKKILLEAGFSPLDLVETSSPQQAQAALEAGKTVLSEDDSLPAQVGMVDVVVDATGSPEAGGRIALQAIQEGKHIVSLNVESDVVAGPLLTRMARQAGVVYTGSAGDEPGAVMELYDFALSMGVTPLVIGKGKNNPLNYSSNPDTAAEAAARHQMNPRMLASFQDGTKTMVEMTAMANATGFLPDCPGAHGPAGGVNDLLRLYRTRQEGGILEHYGVVEYVNGVAPGVFLIYTTPHQELRQELAYLSQGEGPHYLLYRPYHLTSLETPRTILRAVLYGEGSILPAAGAPYADTVAVAKRDLKAGETLDGIGGYTAYGTILTRTEAKACNAFPMGLTSPGVKVLRDIPQGTILTWDMVQPDEDSVLLKLRRQQDALEARGSL